MLRAIDQLEHALGADQAEQENQQESGLSNGSEKGNMGI
jgi:hypothetical protein